MLDKYFGLIYNFIKNNSRLSLCVIGLLNIIAIGGLFGVRFDDNIELMLPADKDISRSINFLRDSNLSNRVVISLSLTAADKDKKDLLLAVDQLAAHLDHSLFSEIVVGMSAPEMTKSMDFLVEHTPQIFSAKDLAYIDTQINSKSISERLGNIYRQILKPGGIFVNKMVRSDPLGLNLLALDKLKALSAHMGYNINVEDGHFISKDGRHAMLIAKTPVQVTDILGAEKLFSALDKQFKQLPDYISASVISGHSHTLSNKKGMSRDILLTSVITSIAFLTLFVVILKDVSSILIFLIPLSAVILSINLYYLFWGKLSYSVVGLGAVLAGISVDYAIHVYIAVRLGKDAFDSVKQVRLPVFAGAVTTIALFIAFFSSEIKGYHQLAAFSILAIVLAFIYSLFVLPHFLPANKGFAGLEKLGIISGFKCSSNLSVIVWALLTLVFLALSFRVKLDSDIKKLDGTDAKILQEEARFQSIWGQKRMGIFVTTGDSYEAALELNDIIYKQAINAIGVDNFSSLSTLWPSEKTRQENAARWKQFWQAGRAEKLRNWLEIEGLKYQLAKDAFSPFFDKLYEYKAATLPDDPTNSGFLTKLKERFVQRQGDKYRALSFFPEDKESVAALLDLSRLYPDTFLVSGIALSDSISAGVYRNIERMLPVAVILLVLLTYLCLQNIRGTIIALVPVATSMVWLFGLMTLFDLSLNGANLIACVILSGLCADYGIFMVYEFRGDLDIGTDLAVALAALTTIIGAGSLVFAKHPALFSVGITMFIGISTGYMASVFVVPQLCAIFLPPGKKIKLL